MSFHGKEIIQEILVPSSTGTCSETSNERNNKIVHTVNDGSDVNIS